MHIPGTEYLAADPVDVPKLKDIIKNCTEQDNASIPEVFTPDQSSPETKMITAENAGPFLHLPPELKLSILRMLEYRDVSNLRLVTRAWNQLPQTFFRDLILEKMPWLWEVRNLRHRQINWHWLWTTLSRSDGGKTQLGEQERRSSTGLSFRAQIDRDENRRIQGLVNRRRIWKDAGEVVEKIAEGWESPQQA